MLTLHVKSMRLKYIDFIIAFIQNINLVTVYLKHIQFISTITYILFQKYSNAIYLFMYVHNMYVFIYEYITTTTTKSRDNHK